MDQNAIIVTVIGSVVAAAGVAGRALLAYLASTTKADRDRVDADRRTLDNQTKELLEDARAERKAMREERQARDEAHATTEHNLRLALEALRAEIADRSSDHTRLLFSKTQEVLGAINDRKISQAALRAVEQTMRRSNPGEPPPSEDEPRNEIATERPFERSPARRHQNDPDKIPTGQRRSLSPDEAERIVRGRPQR